jgi:hypothetical protein|tara:strand:+ start:664 stop:855 length:192 start_codon:yes stop_codon:yes gene_type:complete
MRIFLTEFEEHGTLFAGTNIFAETEEEADTKAQTLGLIIIGEITAVAFRPEFEEEAFLSHTLH